MGLLISRFRTKKSTIEVLEDIDKDINRLQKNRKQNQERQKKIVTSLLIYSIAAYVLSAIIFFVYYFPDTWKLRFLYSLPLLVFPLLIWGLKKLLHWYFVKRIASNDGELLKLREQKKQILEDVMEKETYKKAKEILEKFDPVRFRKLEALPEVGNSPSGPGGTPGTAVHQRSFAVRATPSRPSLVQQQRQMMARTPMSTPRMPVPQPRPLPAPTPVKTSTPYPVTPNLPPRYPGGQQTSGGPRPQQQQQAGSVSRQPPQQHQQQQQSMMGGTPMMPSRGYAMPPGPPMPRTILPQQRGTMDRLMDYLVGDGPENRYALICQQCFSHNGMALKEEFEYLTFRCCYCYYVNPARKQRPMAPRLEFFAPRSRNFNTDSQGSAASDDDSDDEEDGNSGEEEGGNGRPTNKADNTPTRQDRPRPGTGRGRGGHASDGDAVRSVKVSAAAVAAGTSVNRSTNAVPATSTPVRPGPQQQRQNLRQPSPEPHGGADTEAKRKEAIRVKSVIAASPQALSKESGAEVKTHRESLGKTESNVVKSEHQEQEMEHTKSQNSFVSDGGTNSIIVPSSTSPTDDGEGDPDIPFMDEGDRQVSSLPNKLQLSEEQTNEDMSSFVSGTTEGQLEIFTSVTSETDVRSSLSTSLADQGNVVDSFHGGQGEIGESHRLHEEHDGGQERGPTLSEEIRDSVKSLLSPSAPASVGDDRDGGSTHSGEDNVFASVDRERLEDQFMVLS